MIQPIIIDREIDSLRALELYLERHGFTLATNLEAPAEELLRLSRSDWKKDTQGCILKFVVQDRTDEDDPKSPVGKKITPINRTPVLSRFLDGMCGPFDLTCESIGAGQIIYVRKVA